MEKETTTKKTNLVEVELFKDSKDYKDDVFVAVNGNSVLIKRGEKVKIDKKYAEALENSIKQDKETARLMEAKADEYAYETRAKNI